MKILIIARGYPTEKYRMNGIFEFDQAKAMASTGVNVIYAAVDSRSIRRWRKWGLERKNIDGVEMYILNIPLGRIPKRIYKYICKTALNSLFKKIVKEEGKPDVIHAHFSKTGYLLQDIKHKYQVPIVLTEHLSTLMNKSINNDILRIAEDAYKIADKVITVSPALKSVLEENFNTQAIYIPNIVDTNLFSPMTKKDRSADYYFISIGSLINRKRMDLTINSFIDAFKNEENVYLNILGEGPERESLQHVIDKNGMSSRIKLLGLLSRKDVAEHLKRSNCFVLASEAETFGVVYIEAMAVGLPVIATKCGGPEHFVNINNGLLIERNDKIALSESMKSMYSRINEYDSEYIVSSIKDKYSLETVSKQLLDVYKRVIIECKKQ